MTPRSQSPCPGASPAAVGEYRDGRAILALQELAVLWGGPMDTQVPECGPEKEGGGELCVTG